LTSHQQQPEPHRLRNRRKICTILLPVTGILVALALTACGAGVGSTPTSGGSDTTPASSAPAAPVSATTTPSFTLTEGADVCNDLNTWLQTVWNQNMPRFDATMESDEEDAQGTQLGTDLTSLDSDLQSENIIPLLAGPPGDPSDIQLVAQDCAGYGVTIAEGGTPVRLPS
jgi:hypothetical protein